MIRDLDEMRAFKKSEATLITRIKDGSPVDQIISEMELKHLRHAHAIYIQSEIFIQPLFARMGLAGEEVDS